MAFHVWKKALGCTTFQPHWKAFFNPKASLLAQKNDALRLTIYVRPFGERGGGTRVGSGEGPTWSFTGDVLFYRDGRRMMLVEVRGSSVPNLGTPQELWSRDYYLTPTGPRHYHVAPDGRLLMIREAREAGPLDCIGDPATPSAFRAEFAEGGPPITFTHQQTTGRLST